MNVPTPITLEGTKAWFEKAQTTAERFDFVLEKDNELLAMTGLIPSLQKKEHESYTFVNPKFLGQGFGTLTNYLALAYAFELTNVKLIKSVIDMDNYPSIKVYMKLGFELKKIIKDGVEKEGMKKDRHVFYCEKEKFNSSLFQYKVCGESICILESV